MLVDLKNDEPTETGCRGIIPYHGQVSRRLCEAYKFQGHTNRHAEKKSNIISGSKEEFWLSPFYQ